MGAAVTRLRYAVIPTRDRPQDFADCIEAIAPQVDAVFVVAHLEASAYAEPTMLATLGTTRAFSVIRYSALVPNISTMWNLGLSSAHRYAADRPYDVAILNDDVIVPPDWFNRVTAAMAVLGPGRASAGCVRRALDPRMTGYAFILNGDDSLRADERFQWWFGDDDLERQARALGGVAYAVGADVIHRHPNSTTVGRLAEIAAEDRTRFAAKWDL